jgi:hypothetical protein
VGNSKRSKRQHRQKQRKAAVETKKLTLFFAHVANDDNNNEDDEHQDTYLALTFKLPINPCGQIWATPAKFGRKSSILTDIISAKKKILTNGLRNFVQHVKYCVNTSSFLGYTLCGKNI